MSHRAAELSAGDRNDAGTPLLWTIRPPTMVKTDVMRRIASQSGTS